MVICNVTKPSRRIVHASQVSTKTTVVNFSVKQLGLEAQLLGIVVQREQPSLEEQSSELTVKVSTHAQLPACIVSAGVKYPCMCVRCFLQQ